jgi:hypothetical protein
MVAVVIAWLKMMLLSCSNKPVQPDFDQVKISLSCGNGRFQLEFKQVDGKDDRPYRINMPIDDAERIGVEIFSLCHQDKHAVWMATTEKMWSTLH